MLMAAKNSLDIPLPRHTNTGIALLRGIYWIGLSSIIPAAKLGGRRTGVFGGEKSKSSRLGLQKLRVSYYYYG